MAGAVTIQTSFAAAALLLAATAAQAQNSPASQPVPGLDTFSLPTTARPTPLPPEPEPTTNAAPRPVASATPNPVTPPPVVQTVRPTPVATPTRRAVPKPTATPLATATPPAQPVTTPTPVAIVPPPVLPDAAAPTPVPVASPAQPPVAAPASDASMWLVGIGAIVLLAGAGGIWWWRRSSRTEDDSAPADESYVALQSQPVAESESLPTSPLTPEPAAPVQSGFVTVRAPLAPPQPAARAALEIELIPKRAGTDAAGALVEYLIVVRNRGTAPAVGVRLDVRLLGAGARQDGLISALFAAPVASPITPPFAIDPGNMVELGGSAGHPRETLDVIAAGERSVFVPVLTVNLRYDWAGGSGQTAQSFVIGIARGAEAKLQPFPIGPVPRLFENVSAIDYTVTVIS